MSVVKLSAPKKPVKLERPQRTHVEVTPEIEEAARKWLENPLLDSDEVVALKRENAELKRAIEALRLRVAA